MLTATSAHTHHMISSQVGGRVTLTLPAWTPVSMHCPVCTHHGRTPALLGRTDPRSTHPLALQHHAAMSGAARLVADLATVQTWAQRHAHAHSVTGPV